MRVLRSKAVRKYLKLYKVIFGITSPYMVVLDGNFIFTALKYKLDIRHRVETLLQESNIKLFILKSVLDELRNVGDKASSALAWAQECCEILDDSRLSDTSTPLDRLKSVLEKKRYFVATQDRDLRLALNRIPGVPLLYFNKVTLVLESPSKASLNFNRHIEEAKMSVRESEQELVNKVSKMKSVKSNIVGVDSSSPANTERQRIKKKATAPNPLSKPKAKSDSVKSQKKKTNKFRRS